MARLFDVLEGFQIRSPFICLVGSIATWECSTNDVDIFLFARKNSEDSFVKEVALQLRSRLKDIPHHILYEFETPFTTYIPLYDLTVVKLNTVKRYAPVFPNTSGPSKVSLKAVVNLLKDDICLQENFVSYLVEGQHVTFYLPFLPETISIPLQFRIYRQLPQEMWSKISFSIKTPPAEAITVFSLILQRRLSLTKIEMSTQEPTTGSYLVTCQNCKNNFDYTKIIEVAMGAIECPFCSHVIDQEGKVLNFANTNFNEYISYIKKVPGHVGSDGKKAEFCIMDEETHKIMRCFETREAAEKALKLMGYFKQKKLSYDARALIDSFEVFEFKALGVGKPFFPPKPVNAVRVFFKNNHYLLEEPIKKVVEFSDNEPVFIEKKFDGARVFVWKINDKVKITSESGFNITERLPTLVKQATQLGSGTFCIDGELEMYLNGNHQSREVTSGYINATTPADDSNLVLNVFDTPYLNNDLTKLSLEERQKHLATLNFKQSVFQNPSVSIKFNLVPTILCKSAADINGAIHKVFSSKDSEGAMIKKASGIFPLDGSAECWMKLKKSITFTTIIWRRVETKTPHVYNYDVAVAFPQTLPVPEGNVIEVKQEKFMRVGRTFNVAEAFSVGDLIEVSAHIVNYYADESKREWLHFYEPAFEDKSVASTPSTFALIKRLSRDAGLLTEKIITEA